MPSREEFLKWEEEVRNKFGGGVFEDYLEALCNRVWNEAIEAAAKLCDRSHTPYPDDYTQGAEDASNLRAEEIRQLKQGETK